MNTYYTTLITKVAFNTSTATVWIRYLYGVIQRFRQSLFRRVASSTDGRLGGDNFEPNNVPSWLTERNAATCSN